MHEHTYPGLVISHDRPRVPAPHPWNHNQDIEEKMSQEDVSAGSDQRRGKWKSIKRAGTSMKKYLRKKMAGGSGSKNDVIEVHIRPEDDTDYDKQWTRRIPRAQTFDSEGRSCSSQSSSAKSRDSEKSRDLSSRSDEPDQDGIMVVHDAGDDLHLHDLDL